MPQTLKDNQELREKIANELDNYRRFAQDYEDDKNIAIDTIMAAIKAWVKEREQKLLERVEAEVISNTYQDTGWRDMDSDAIDSYDQVFQSGVDTLHSKTVTALATIKKELTDDAS